MRHFSCLGALRVGVGVLSIAGAVLARSAAKAEIIYVVGSTSPNLNAGTGHLYSFDTATPGTVTDVVVNGPGFSGQYITDIDFKPGTNTLYGLGYTGSVYTLDTGTGLATSVATALSSGGPNYNLTGIDFNPITGNLRVVDPFEGNRQLNVLTNIRTNDVNPAYAAGDPNVGRSPWLQDIAYNAAGSAFVLDFTGATHNGPTLDTLSPETGGANSLHTLGSLGASGFSGGFDISGNSSIAYVILNSAAFSGNTKTLYSINLATGAATSLGTVGIGADVDVYGLSVAPTANTGGGSGVPLPAGAWGGLLAMAALVKCRRTLARIPSTDCPT